MRNYAKTLHKSSSNICFGYLLELPQRGNSNKYPKHMFYEEIRMKQGLSYISFCPYSDAQETSDQQSSISAHACMCIYAV